MFSSIMEPNKFFALAVLLAIMAFYFWKKDKVSKKFEGFSKSKTKTPILDSFTVDLTNLEAEGEIDPVIGRTMETDRVTQILSRRTKNNPILLGRPGVGKTAIVEGLALKIVTGDVPQVLANKRVLSLQLAEILAGTKYRGEFEERARKLVKEIQNSERNIILFIDEIHTLIEQKGTEGSVDLTDILKPALARGQLQLIGATTIGEYEKYIKPDASLERRFQIVEVAEPTTEDTISILSGIKKNYEEYHNVRFTNEAIRAAVLLSEKHIKGRVLPDKAIDVIDEAAAMVKVAHSDTHHAIELLNKAASKVKDAHKKLPPQLEKLRKQLTKLKQQEKSTQGKEKLKKIRKETIQKVREIETMEIKLSMQKGRPIVDVIHIKEVVSDWTGKKIK